MAHDRAAGDHPGPVPGRPATIEGQGPGLDEELARFREQRSREPEGIPQMAAGQVEGIAPEGIGQ